MFVQHVACFFCDRRYAADQSLNTCDCGKSLRVVYDFDRVRRAVRPADFAGRGRGMWRFREVLPVPSGEEPVTLGEGDTPLIRTEALGRRLGIERLFVKDESVNPTGSFKARGMSAAVTMARRLGHRRLYAPSAGNAGGALAAYAAAAGLEANVFVPADTPEVNVRECELFGARVHRVDGLIDRCGREAARACEEGGGFNVSTLKEPYRVEGKKTLGYEIVEQLGWRFPDVIVYPTGGGAGLIGMHKAFEEITTLGWAGGPRPRFVVVQPAGCAPIVRAWTAGAERAAPVEGAHTVASGLRVPSPFADALMLRVLKESGGTAVVVDDAQMLSALREGAGVTGISFCPEGAACIEAVRRLSESRWLRVDETVVLFNTGAATKYLEVLRSVVAGGSS
ncbi:MAG: threonine synthase [Phycisphaerae bacterium]|nr:MAG: threonine synthase [Planctomycetota bacterium]KAB2941891.1 MAG: threonine synthase [Phycisphaerae bacterium]MBE7458644.1 threonine synthase [Planctomycetia bacterium]MCK6466408.1 threonine synthase [Phycisphaerae bacterium]MCL4720191.1 threonine synthase [Phycisphaerae bacterium]